MFECIFDYIDRLFSIVRPRKLLYMAIGALHSAQTLPCHQPLTLRAQTAWRLARR